MRTLASLTAAAVLTTGLGIGSASAEPGGCLKYGAAGAVGGHVVGHGILGAVGGCATGMLRRHEYRKQQREMVRQQENGAYPVNPGYNNNANPGYNNTNPGYNNANPGYSGNPSYNNDNR